MLDEPPLMVRTQVTPFHDRPTARRCASKIRGATLQARQNGARSGSRAATVMERCERIASPPHAQQHHRPLGAETTTGTSTFAFPLLTVIFADPGAIGFTMLLGSTVTTLGVSEVKIVVDDSLRSTCCPSANTPVTLKYP